MSNEVTLAQLAAEMAELRQQVEQANQRLDMIYGAVTRLAQAGQNGQAYSPAPFPPEDRGRTPPRPIGGRQGKEPAGGGRMPLSARMVMDPGSMLESLRQYALNAGLDVTPEAVDRLKSDLPAGE